MGNWPHFFGSEEVYHFVNKKIMWFIPLIVKYGRDVEKKMGEGRREDSLTIAFDSASH